MTAALIPMRRTRTLSRRQRVRPLTELERVANELNAALAARREAERLMRAFSAGPPHMRHRHVFNASTKRAQALHARYLQLKAEAGGEAVAA